MGQLSGPLAWQAHADHRRANLKGRHQTKDRHIEVEELANFNCNFGYPCQFSQPPSDGYCEAAVIYHIEKGHYGDVKLDGLRVSGVYKWPGAIHEDSGHMQLIIDKNATAEQRAALEKIMTGADTDEMATMWSVFSTMCPDKHETLTASNSVDMDREERTGLGSVDGVFEISAQPIPNVVTGEPHRISITLPRGVRVHHGRNGVRKHADKGGRYRTRRGCHDPRAFRAAEPDRAWGRPRMAEPGRSKTNTGCRMPGWSTVWSGGTRLWLLSPSG